MNVYSVVLQIAMVVICGAEWGISGFGVGGGKS